MDSLSFTPTCFTTSKSLSVCVCLSLERGHVETMQRDNATMLCVEVSQKRCTPEGVVDLNHNRKRWGEPRPVPTSPEPRPPGPCGAP